MISSYTQTLWATFLRHDIISKDPDLIAFISRLFQSATKTLLKVSNKLCKYLMFMRVLLTDIKVR